jgi:hypothetical protein
VSHRHLAVCFGLRQSHYLAQDVLKLMILPPQPLKCWNYRHISHAQLSITLFLWTFLFFFFVSTGPCACQSGTLPLEPCLQLPVYFFFNTYFTLFISNCFHTSVLQMCVFYSFSFPTYRCVSPGLAKRYFLKRILNQIKILSELNK